LVPGITQLKYLGLLK